MVWFATVYMIFIILHEAAHAVTAVAIGFPSKLFNFCVNHDSAGATTARGILLTPSQGYPSSIAVH